MLWQKHPLKFAMLVIQGDCNAYTNTVPDLTPRRIYFGQNICLICAFSFIYTDILSTGVMQEVKLLKHKLCLMEERIENVRKIIPSFTIKEVDRNSGVCVKCLHAILDFQSKCV